jgi:hypothetical protein
MLHGIECCKRIFLKMSHFTLLKSGRSCWLLWMRSALLAWILPTQQYSQPCQFQFQLRLRWTAGRHEYRGTVCTLQSLILTFTSRIHVIKLVRRIYKYKACQTVGEGLWSTRHDIFPHGSMQWHALQRRHSWTPIPRPRASPCLGLIFNHSIRPLGLQFFLAHCMTTQQ